jgi:2-polyprenyl-3-methyl-5-hydroxy-6-metoxy-1,4-benzoquinol methylase
MTSPVVDLKIQKQFDAEVRAGERFTFGENWRAFLGSISDDRIAQAVASVQALLQMPSLEGKTFLDIGSGSGLFSLAAHKLGAKVTSFDYDPSSVGCAVELRQRFGRPTNPWEILHGSALDADFVGALGQFDVVYSWGVLHHTGAMWTGIRNAMSAVKPGGTLCLALYNDQGAVSKRWTVVKRIYCSGAPGKYLMSSLIIPYWVARSAASDLVRGRAPWHSLVTYRSNRGMSPWYDWHDWLGGYPFEVARPEDIIMPLQRDGFCIKGLVTQAGTMGCVEYVFERET